MRKSAVVTYPKQAFLDWVKEFSKNDILKRKPENIYFTDESPVWLIPSLGTFDSQDAYEKYANSLKPKLLHSEISSVTKDTSYFEPLDAEKFDQYFTLELRAAVVDISELVN